ncbi:enoyl-CoA hydratase/isomerase family protein [Modestobacter excelsi]|uniref:enoyl-CoA hydratase/isomerase family protein n=1 Tax=Modestobacter excelsi TaxID=2213161 RepID=UPI001C20EFDA|nr:enoyl-CoA hydratase-related protein [Modestobacter excelsi]
MADEVLMSVERGVATLTLNRPDQHNTLSIGLVNLLGDFLAQCRDDPRVKVVVITHAGRTFCAGADLKRSATDGEERRHRVVDVISTIMDYPKPTVARIGGSCMAGGIGIAAACDISVAVESAKFGFTEVRIGVAPAIISVVCLEKLSRADALDLFLTGRRIDATRAAAIGLITEATDAEELDGRVDAVLTDLLAGGPSALMAVKELVREVPRRSREDAFEWAADLSARLFSSEEAREGMQAFREKRPAPWTTTATGQERGAT